MYTTFGLRTVFSVKKNVLVFHVISSKYSLRLESVDFLTRVVEYKI
jgi:hypothetical protein